MNLRAVLLLALCSAVQAREELRLPFEQDVPLFNAETSSWMKGEKPHATDPITFTVAVRVDDDKREALEKVFWEVSNPDGEHYGNHLNTHQVAELLAVPEERAEGVRKYFMNQGAVSAITAPTRDLITVTMPVKSAEVALDTEIFYFSHRYHRKLQIKRASARYSLPYPIAQDVVMVGELLQFPNPPSHLLRGVAGAGSWPNSCQAQGCQGLVTPSVIAQAYKFPKSNGTANAGKNSMAVAEFQGQYYKDTDLKSFGQSCHVDATVAKNIGKNEESAGIESELDIEYIKAGAPEVPLTVIYNAQYSLLDWANALTSMDDPPLVASVSYGNDEAQQTSAQYMYTCNTAFMKAGVKGISILFASGDQGVCGREGCGFFKFTFKPDFPAASPYITAVGGTDFLGDTIGAEMAWTNGGGGFSNTFPMPDYQKEAVEGYLKSSDANLPPQSYYNASGRGYPDVAALGGTKAPYCVATSGMFEGVAGTSASCPVVASVFAKLNGIRLSNNKPPMGFLNPWIYKNPSGFQDVTHGCNKANRNYGFTAIKGWDAATGLGTPNFEVLAKLVLTTKSNNIVV